MPTVIYSGRFENLAEISKFIKEVAKKADFGESATYAVQLAVDEACSNIIEHAYGGDGEGDIQCTCEDTEEGLKITLRDQGRTFNPDDVPPVDVNLPLEEVEGRGAGIYLIRKLMDEVKFETGSESGNVLILVKRKED